MKGLLLIILTFVLIQGCNNAPTNLKKEAAAPPAKAKESFFPVTDFIKGQIYEITAKGITPVRYTTINNHTDSSWLSHDELNDAFKEFLHPVIDSTNLTALFTEKKFLDQTINAITFTYDAKSDLPDSMNLQHWDVYVDPVSGKVRRIYLVKSAGINKTLQLTWLGNRSCKMITIDNAATGNSSVEKEVNIIWDF
jgi:hypothetical protein